jgi:hypothetical protein
VLILRRQPGQWIEVTDRAGHVLRIRVGEIRPGRIPEVRLDFDDDARNFEIVRPETKAPGLPAVSA